MMMVRAKREVLTGFQQQGSATISIPKEHHRHLLGKGGSKLQVRTNESMASSHLTPCSFLIGCRTWTRLACSWRIRLTTPPPRPSDEVACQANELIKTSSVPANSSEVAPITGSEGEQNFVVDAAAPLNLDGE